MDVYHLKPTVRNSEEDEDDYTHPVVKRSIKIKPRGIVLLLQFIGLDNIHTVAFVVHINHDNNGVNVALFNDSELSDRNLIMIFCINDKGIL